VHSFLGRYSYRQTHLSNRVCLGIENPTAPANQPRAYRGGHYHGIWSEEAPAIFGERPGPSTTVAASDLPCQAYVMTDIALRHQEDMPMSEKIENLPAWPALVGGYGQPPLDWRRQLLFLKGDAPGGDRYVILRDTVKGGAATRWQMWTTSEKIGTPEQVANRETFLADKPGAQILPARELPGGNRYTALGRFGVDLDYYIASPTDTPRHTLRWGITYKQYNTLYDYADYQDLLHLQLPGDGAYFVALFPRAQEAPAPVFSTRGEGTIIKVTGAFGTDHAFLSAQHTTATGDAVAFTGTAASVQDRQGALMLSLAAAGEVRYKEWGLKAEVPAGLRVDAGGATVTLSRERAEGTVRLTLPGNWKSAEPTAGVTLTRDGDAYLLHLTRLPGGVRLVKE
jgi:hypothetical protein